MQIVVQDISLNEEIYLLNQVEYLLYYSFPLYFKARTVDLKQFMKGQVKILMRYLINLSREDSVRLVCQLMIFPHSIPLCPII